ncbi:MAG: rhodanese-like protein [Paucimonas sp.]|jgi:rhodanese-related sulfurtransferase|nr:rhodanese-like protein [Paucimonas sp.]
MAPFLHFYFFIVKFFLDNLWLVALAVLSGGALLWPSLNRGARVSLLQATQMINQGKTVVLDVRDAAAYAAGHLNDSRNIPLSELPKRVGELDKFKSKSVVVVCESGTRSGRALGLLKKAGFGNVFSLEGGISAWQAQGLPLAK